MGQLRIEPQDDATNGQPVQRLHLVEHTITATRPYPTPAKPNTLLARRIPLCA